MLEGQAVVCTNELLILLVAFSSTNNAERNPQCLGQAGIGWSVSLMLDWVLDMKGGCLLNLLFLFLLLN